MVQVGETGGYDEQESEEIEGGMHGSSSVKRRIGRPCSPCRRVPIRVSRCTNLGSSPFSVLFHYENGTNCAGRNSMPARPSSIA
jgi:hypothetical protein